MAVVSETLSLWPPGDSETMVERLALRVTGGRGPRASAAGDRPRWRPVAIGALAVGAVAIGRLALGRVSIKRLTIEELEVTRLKVTELEVAGEQRPRV